MQEEMGMAVVSRVFPGGQWGELVQSYLLLQPPEPVRAFKVPFKTPQSDHVLPWAHLAKHGQVGAVISSWDCSPYGSKASLERFKIIE